MPAVSYYPTGTVFDLILPDYVQAVPGLAPQTGEEGRHLSAALRGLCEDRLWRLSGPQPANSPKRQGGQAV